VEDPRSAMVAQASFWWHGGALLVEHGSIGVRMIRCVPRQRRLVAEPCQFVEQRYEYLFYDYRTPFSIHDKVKYT
jgi:hypothetical protein